MRKDECSCIQPFALIGSSWQYLKFSFGLQSFITILDRFGAFAASLLAHTTAK